MLNCSYFLQISIRNDSGINGDFPEVSDTASEDGSDSPWEESDADTDDGSGSNWEGSDADSRSSCSSLPCSEPAQIDKTGMTPHSAAPKQHLHQPIEKVVIGDKLGKHFWKHLLEK